MALASVTILISLTTLTLDPVAIGLAQYVFSYEPSISLELMFVAAVVYALRTKLAAIIRQPTLDAAPAWYLNAFLEPMSSSPDGRCPVCSCHFIDPRRISCHHVFCYSCALITFATQDSCPICAEVPKQVIPVAPAVSPARHLARSWDPWQKNYLFFNFGQALTQLWNWRFPGLDDTQVIVTRVAMQLFLEPAILDCLSSVADLNMLNHHTRGLAASTAQLCVLVFTFPADPNVVTWLWFGWVVGDIGVKIKDIRSALAAHDGSAETSGSESESQSESESGSESSGTLVADRWFTVKVISRCSREDCCG